jgi:UDP-glucose 6-dehydrogenase
MKLNDLMQVVNAVKSMNEKEINLIIDAIKQNRKRTSVLSSTQFSVGQKVIFGKPRGQKRSGVIEKMNPTKALISVYDNFAKRTNKWRVPYSLMKAVA